MQLALSPYVVASNGRGSGEPRMPGGYKVVQYQQRWGLSLTLGWLASLKRRSDDTQRVSDQMLR